MSPAHHRYRFPILPRIALLCAGRASASSHPSPSICNSLFTTNLQIPLPATRLFSHLYKTPGVLPILHYGSPAADFARQAQLQSFHTVADSLSLLHPPSSFVFSSLHALLQKHPGVGYFRSLSRLVYAGATRRGAGTGVPCPYGAGGVTSTRKRRARVYGPRVRTETM